MEKWSRFNYQPCLPLGKEGARVTGCREHIELSRKAAGEGMVLLKMKDLCFPSVKDRNWQFLERLQWTM